MTQTMNQPDVEAQEWSVLLEHAEQAAGEACGLLRAGTVEAFSESAAPIGRCLAAVQRLDLASAAAPRLVGIGPALRRLRRRSRELAGLHQQAARFYLGRLEALTRLAGHYGPQGWVVPVPPPRVRVEA